jgi:nitric oxide synthase-interacting protein
MSVDPVSCSHGDIFCRECALSNILTQKKQIKRAEKSREQEEKDTLEEKARQDNEAQERAILEFELTQAGLSIKPGRVGETRKELDDKDDKDDTETGKPEAAKTGEKRKFSLDEDEVSRIAQEERAKARKAIEEEKVREDM